MLHKSKPFFNSLCIFFLTLLCLSFVSHHKKTDQKISSPSKNSSSALVEVQPKPAALIKSTKGQSVTRTLTIINHSDTSMSIKDIEYERDLFEVTIKEIKQGKEFLLSVVSRPDAPYGEHRKKAVIHTNLLETNQITIATWLKMRKRIFTNIEFLDFDERSMTDVKKPGIIEKTTETVIINGSSTPGFKVLSATSDVDFLEISLSPIAKNQIHRVDVSFKKDKLIKGAFQGNLTVLTNDQEFRKIVLPIDGKLY